jgi:hypothetical protein
VVFCTSMRIVAGSSWMWMAVEGFTDGLNRRCTLILHCGVSSRYGILLWISSASPFQTLDRGSKTETSQPIRVPRKKVPSSHEAVAKRVSYHLHKSTHGAVPGRDGALLYGRLQIRGALMLFMAFACLQRRHCALLSV